MKKFLMGMMILLFFGVLGFNQLKAGGIMDSLQEKWLKAHIESENSFSSASGLYIKGYVFYDDAYEPVSAAGPYLVEYLSESQVYDVIVNQLGWTYIASFQNSEIYYVPKGNNATDLFIIVYYINGLAHQAIMINGTLP